MPKPSTLESVVTAMEYLADEGQVASIRAIVERSGIRSTSTVYWALIELVLAGKARMVRAADDAKAAFYVLVSYKCPVCGAEPKEG